MKKLLIPLIILCLVMVARLTWAQQQEGIIQIRVEGLNDTLKTQIVNILTSRSRDITTPITTDKVNQFYQKAPLVIQKGLQPYGYFNAQVNSFIKQNGNIWTLTFHVSQGPPVRVIHVDFQISGEGTQDKGFNHLSKNIPIKAGQIFTVENYQASKDALFNLASNRGYFDAKMDINQIIMNVEAKQASIVLHFNTGHRYRFGPTLFPPTDLNSDFLARYLRYRQGDYYNNAAVQKTQQVLAGSGYFSQTVVTPQPTQAANHEVPVKIDLTPVKPQRYTFGLGYGTDTGPRGTLGFNWIPVNSYGHHVNLLARGSYIKINNQKLQNNTINGSYIIPGNDPSTDSYAISAGYGNIIQDSISGFPNQAESFKTAVSYNTLFGEDWLQTLALTYLTERSKFNSDTVEHTANLLYPSGHWDYIHDRAVLRNKIINNGVSGSFDILAASQQVLSETNVIQIRAAMKALATFEPTHTRFLFRSQIGRTQIDDLNDLPLTLQLYAGGPTSIRGYKYNSIGPGKNLVIVSGEIQQRVYNNWYLAAFIDAGSVTETNQPKPKYLREVAGAGGGVVVLTPIGAVELDVARPLPINNTTQKTWQLEFSVGAEL